MKTVCGITRQRVISRMMFLAFASLSMTLPACTLLPSSAPLQTFILPPSKPVDASNAAPLKAILRIATPQANEILKGRRILVMPTSNQLNVYQGARWSLDAPSLLRDHLMDVFRRNGRLAGVIGENNPVDSDFLLLSELHAFHSEYRGKKPWAVIRLDVQLIDSTSRDLLASRRFSVPVESQDERLESVVEAFGQAVDELSRQLVEWSLINIANHPAS
ncbi:ABC-type transport auxiliary lipoprotein family protein [Nitrosococcus watsonii]|uniref:ABC-type transport auxiliary lipoprotein component domain-containing protein n=1 Tax=Nitrosococcus watsoni (strain C-113) TaxID=105559 RepID=D8K6G3_NITWC|nr:ABC-type transport auxiliary lipoprotein family protein [Nitrosococcus watsonii]ADJ28490.1 protein of unknown function DUF330 [Nitrosococcus watsonii C-113]